MVPEWPFALRRAPLASTPSKSIWREVECIWADFKTVCP